MADAPQHKMVVVQDATITSMAGNTAYLKEFPFLKSLQNAPKKKGCGSCGSGANNRNRSDTFQAAKRTLAGMSSERKATLKRMLNTKSVRIIFRDDKNKTIELTF